jgi:mRNA interferase RelE/StbE
MTVEFKASFARDLKKIKDQWVLRQVLQVIQETECAQSLLEIPNLKRLRVEGHSYRIRLGDYRIGLVMEGETVIFVRFLHRRDIYRYFP